MLNAMLEYFAINGYKLEELQIDNIDKLKKQDIKMKLLPTLKDRNPRKNNIDEMKQEVRKYLKDIIETDEKIIEFYKNFQNGIYKPELIFTDKAIINRIKEHPMIMWKLNSNI